MSASELDFFPANKGAAKLARFGYEHDDWGRLPVVSLKPGDRLLVRLMPAFDGSNDAALKLVHHRWPGFREKRRFNVFAVCPAQSSDVLTEHTSNEPCPACAAGVGIRRSAIVFALVEDKRKAIALRFYDNQFPVLNQLLNPTCFDYAAGRQVELWNHNWELKFELLDPYPIDQEAFRAAISIGDLHVRAWTVNHALLHDMAEAKKGWQTSGNRMPYPGQHVRLKRLLPHCTLVRAPWGFKGPRTLAWQNTEFALMQNSEYCDDLDEGNIVVLCGRDQAAVDKGLVPDCIVICLDADDEGFRQELLALNAWLADTFAVVGERGCKWFFTVSGVNMATCPPSSKIRRRKGNRNHRDDPEVGDWLNSGNAGAIWGLHPSGRMYTPNWKPLQTAQELELPDGYYLAAAKPENVEWARAAEFARIAGLEDEAVGQSSGAILDLKRLHRVRQAGGQTEAQCPACHAEGKDTACDNLRIYQDGRYSCAAYIGMDELSRHEHNQKIFALAGIGPRHRDDGENDYDDEDTDE